MATTTGFGQIPDLRCKTLSSFGRLVMDKYGNLDVPNVSIDHELTVGIGGNVIFPATSINFRNSAMDFTGASIVGFTGNIQGNYTITELLVTSNITTTNVYAQKVFADIYGNLVTSSTVSANIITNYITIPNGEITINANIYTNTIGKHTGNTRGIHFGEIRESSPGADIEVVGTLLGNLTGTTVCVNSNLYVTTIVGKDLPEQKINIIGNTVMGNVIMETLTVLGNFFGTITGTLEGPVITDSIETDGFVNAIMIAKNPGTYIDTSTIYCTEVFVDDITLYSLFGSFIPFADNTQKLTGSSSFTYNTLSSTLNVTNLITSGSITTGSITNTGTPTSGQVLYTGTSGLIKAETGFEYNDSTNVLTASRIQTSIIPTQRAIFTTTGGELTSQSGYEFDGSNLTVPSLKDTALTNGQIVYAGTSGLLKTEAGFEYNDTTNTITVANFIGTSVSNQLILGSTNTSTINAVAPSVSRIYTLPDVNSNAYFVLNTNQSLKITNPTVNTHSLIGTATSGEAQWGQLSLTSGVSGVLPIINGGTNSSTALLNGTLMISSGGAIVEGTSSSTPIFTSGTLSSISNQLTLGTTNTTTINAIAPSASRIYTIPDVTSNAYFVLNTNQSLKISNATIANQALISTAISGESQWGLLSLTSGVSGTLPIANGGTNSSTVLTNGKIIVSSGGAIVEGTSSSTPTFTSETLTATSNQLTLGTINTTTISATSPATSLVYTLPDIGTNANIVLNTIQALKITNSTTVNYSLISTATSGEAQWGQLSLTSGVTGILPIVNGGTNSATVLTNGRIMISSGGAIVEGTSSSTPSFTSESLTATLNQLTLGSISTITLSAPTPIASRIYSLADAGANASIVLNTNQDLKITNATTLNYALISTAIAGEAQWGQLSLTAGVTGILPITNGGTNSSVALANGKIMISSGGAIVEGTSSSTPTFTSETLTASSNQLTLGTTNTTIISATAPATSIIYTLPDVGSNANFVLDTNQSLKITNTTVTNRALISNASGEAQWSQLNLTAGAAGVTGILPIANGGTNSSATLLNGTLMISLGGAIVEGTSSSTPIFSSETLTSTTNQLILGTANTTTINATAPSASRIYTLPDVGGNANFVMDISQPLTIINASSNGKALVGTATPGQAQWDFLSLGSGIIGVLPIANGGTNSSTTLTNGKIMISSGGAIIEGTSSSNPSFTTTTVTSLSNTHIVYSNSGALVGDSGLTFATSILTAPTLRATDLAIAGGGKIVYTTAAGDLTKDNNFTFVGGILNLPSGGAISIGGTTILNSSLTLGNVLHAGTSGLITQTTGFNFLSSSLNIPTGGSYKINSVTILDGNLGTNRVLFANGVGKVSDYAGFSFSGNSLDIPISLPTVATNGYMINGSTVLDGTLQNTRVLHAGPSGLVANTAGFTFTGGDLLTSPRIKTSNLSVGAEVLFTITGGELTTNSSFTFNGSGLSIPNTTSYRINGIEILNGGLTNQRVLHAGVNGLVTDTAGFTFDGTKLFAQNLASTTSGTNGEIFFTSSPTGTLTTNGGFIFNNVNGDLNIPGTGVYKIGGNTILQPSTNTHIVYGGVAGLYTSSPTFTFTGSNTLNVPYVNATTEIQVAGVKVVDTQQPTITNPTTVPPVVLTPSIGTSDTTLVVIGDTSTVNEGANINDNFEDCRVQINNLISDVTSLRSQMISILNALKAHGLIAP